MKVLLTIVGLALPLFFSTASFAQVASQKAHTAISQEVSALLLEPQYSQILLTQMQLASQSGQTLRVLAFDIFEVGTTQYVYAILASKISADFQGAWNPAGSIVGRLKFGPLGEPGFDSIFFKPAEEAPGGASVGNN